MPLTLSGRLLDITAEDINGGPSAGGFTSTTMHILDGRDVQRVRVGRDFGNDLPKKDEAVSLEVVVSGFARRGGGAGVQMTALRRAGAGHKPVAAVS